MSSWILALAESKAPAQPPSSFMSTLVMMGILFAIMYFLIIRPQAKQNKERRAMLDALKKGDHVVVAGGIHARIVEIGERVLTVEIADKVKIKVNRDAVVGLLRTETTGDTGTGKGARKS